MSNIPGDIIFFIILAVVLLVQFRSILGKTEEGNISNKAPINKDKVIREIKKQIIETNTKDTNVLEISKEVYTNAVNKINKKVKTGIDDIASQDNKFNIEVFLKGAITAFGLIVLGYAKGNLALLKTMLNEEMFNVFNEDISGRKKKQNIDTKIEKMNKINLMDAKLQGTMMYITVKFVSEQTSAIRDEDGQVLSGDPEQSKEITDVWTFARDVRSGNPNWVLVSSEV